MDIRQLLLDSFPKTIDKTGKNFSAIITSSEHNGATESVLQDARDYSMEYINTPEILKQKDEMLKIFMSFITYLERFTNETEAAWKERYKAIFVRGHDTTWGTVFDIKNVFRNYFPSATIFLVENTNSLEENLILNGDFITKDNWKLEGCTLTPNARFSKGLGVELSTGCLLAQTVSLTTNKTYFLHLFAKGGVSIGIRTGTFYWNPETEEWENKKIMTKYNLDEWDGISSFFITKSGVNNVTVEVTLNDGNTYGYVDYFRLYEKKKHPSFTIIAYFVGSSVKNVIALAEGNEDNPDTNTPPNVVEKVKEWGYYDINSLTGVATGFAQDVYQDLLDLVKPAGVKAYIELVNKDYIEGENKI